MSRLLPPAAGVTPQVRVQPKPIRQPEIPSQLAKRKRHVVLCLQKHNVLTLGDRIRGRAQLLGRRRLRHPHLHERHRGDEGGNEVCGRGPRERVVDAGTTKVDPELLDQLLWCLREQMTERSSRTLELLFRPEVKERCLIRNAAHTLRARAFGDDG